MSGNEDEKTKMDDEFRTRCWATEKAAWKVAAKADKRSLSDWVRIVLNAAAEKASKRK